jgi:hypothetical protein
VKQGTPKVYVPATSTYSRGGRDFHYNISAEGIENAAPLGNNRVVVEHVDNQSTVLFDDGASDPQSLARWSSSAGAAAGH